MIDPIRSLINGFKELFMIGESDRIGNEVTKTVHLDRLPKLPNKKRYFDQPRKGPATRPKKQRANSPGPSRIRVMLNRELTPAELEGLREIAWQVNMLSPHDKFRVTQTPEKVVYIYAQSGDADSRTLYGSVASVVAEGFVNVYPVAVRTFRELIKKSR